MASEGVEGSCWPVRRSGMVFSARSFMVMLLGMAEEAQAADALEAIRRFFRRFAAFVSTVVGIALLLAAGAAALWSYQWFTNPSGSELVATINGFVQAFDDDNPAEQARYIYREQDGRDLGGGEQGFRFALDDVNGFGGAAVANYFYDENDAYVFGVLTYNNPAKRSRSFEAVLRKAENGWTVLRFAVMAP